MIAISALNQSSPIKIAQEELTSYLAKMGITSADIKLGLFEDFGKKSSVKDVFWDDEFEISIKDAKGFVAGSNPRSVLFGIYRLLEENGARWVRPGKDGDYIPKRDKLRDVSIREASPHRHRVICVEGSDSYKNILDMINWMPKHALNEYIFQFTNLKAFFDRWYSHELNPFKESEMEITDEIAEQYTKELKDRAIELGLIIQQGGHCFNNEPFGIEFCGWDKSTDDDVPKEFLEICAEVNGHRGIFMNMIVTTQLCYSNPYVMNTITDAVVKFLQERPEIDIVMFDLADGRDNTCECENCTKMSFTDIYVTMLNEIDRKLTEAGITTKVAHEAYNNLFFPPETVKLNNPDRFVMMFCPSTRRRTEPWPMEYANKELPVCSLNNFNSLFQANKVCYPDDILVFLKKWLEVAPTDCFIFDYHLMWDHLLDPGHEAVARVLYNDIKAFRNLGINGLINCQLHRNFFPSSLATVVTGKALWNPEIAYEYIQNYVYDAAFGKENRKAIKEYFETLSECFDMVLIRGLEPCDKLSFISRMEKAKKTIKDFLPYIESHQNEAEICRKTAWAALVHHAYVYSGAADVVLARLNGDEDAAKQITKDFTDYAFFHEDEIQEVLDTHYFCDVLSNRIAPRTQEQFLEFGFDDTITE